MFWNYVGFEFKETYKRILTSIIFVIAAGIFAAVVKATKIPYVDYTSYVLFIGVAIVAMITNIYATISRFGRTMFGNEAYLTHTLPIKSTHIFYAKTLVSFVWNVVSVMLMLGSVAGLLVILGKWTSVADVVSNFSPAFFVIVVFCIVYVCFNINNMVFFSMTMVNTGRFANSSQKMKINGTIIFFITYFVQQIVAVVGMLIVPITIVVRQTDTLELVRTDFKLPYKSVDELINSGSGEYQRLGAGVFIVIIVCMIVIFTWTRKLIDKKICIK